MFLLVMMVLLVVVAGWLDARLNWRDAEAEQDRFLHQPAGQPEATEGWG